MLAGKTWSVSSTNLLGHFREALLALVPIADKIHMPWREPDSYDDWDAIASALYNSIVIRSIESATEDERFFPIPQYDKRIISYSYNSFVSNFELGRGYAFICFQTNNTPFDTCLFAALGEGGHVIGQAHARFEETQFTVVGQKIGTSAILSSLDVVL
jgi:hypothetical protein